MSRIKMTELISPSYVLRTRTIPEKDFQKKVSELGSQLEDIVVVNVEGKNALVRYPGSVEELYQALGYSKKEIVITPEIYLPLP